MTITIIIMKLISDIQIDGEIFDALEEYWAEEYEYMLKMIGSDL